MNGVTTSQTDRPLRVIEKLRFLAANVAQVGLLPGEFCGSRGTGGRTPGEIDLNRLPEELWQLFHRPADVPSGWQHQGQLAHSSVREAEHSFMVRPVPEPIPPRRRIDAEP